jgi:hypothetical protein
MAKPLGGTVYVKVDGEQLSVRGSVTSNIGQTVMREAVIGADQVHGYTETPILPFLQVELTERPEFPLSAINKVSDSTITAELADGRVLMLRNAWHEGEAERNPQAGSIGSVRFVGLSGEEIV